MAAPSVDLEAPPLPPFLTRYIRIVGLRGVYLPKYSIVGLYSQSLQGKGVIAAPANCPTQAKTGPKMGHRPYSLVTCLR